MCVLQIPYLRASAPAQQKMLPQSSLDGCISSMPTFRLSNSTLMFWKHWAGVVRCCVNLLFTWTVRHMHLHMSPKEGALRRLAYHGCEHDIQLAK